MYAQEKRKENHWKNGTLNKGYEGPVTVANCYVHRLGLGKLASEGRRTITNKKNTVGSTGWDI